MQAFSEYFDILNFVLININIRQDIIYKKLTGRRICSKCNRNYNLCQIDEDDYHMKPLLPKIDSKCDNCGGELIRREDDNIKVIDKRMETYYNESLPVFNMMKNNGIPLIDFVPKRGKRDYSILCEKIKKLL